jgi:hypothetical protein
MTKHLLFKSNIMKEKINDRTDQVLLKLFRANFIKSIFFLLLFIHSSTGYSQYVSGDTSVCPGQIETYNFSGGPWTVTVLGGGTLTPPPGGPVNMFTVTWGQVKGSFLIRLVDGGGTTIYQSVVVEGDFALACDDLINVSLDGDCQALITPKIILEGRVYPNSSYQVTVFNTNGLPVPGNIVTHSHLGKTLTVNVRHLCSGVSCWGKIFIEDKFIPELTCKTRPDILNCNDDTSPQSLGFPLPNTAIVNPKPGSTQCYIVTNFDLCCDVELCYQDYYIKNGCNSPTGYYAQIERSWTAVDCKGNKASCKDSIYILQGNISLVECPYNHDGFQLPALECDLKQYPFGPFPSGWNALPNGNPSPYDHKDPFGNVIWYGTGVPTNVSCDHVAVTFKDVRIPVCGNSFKLLRSWKVFDWCTGRLFECVQFIKVTDHKPPIVTCSQNYLTFPMDYYECAGTAIVPPPAFIQDCSSTTFTVEYKLAGPNGQPEAGDYRTDNVSYVGGNAVITGLPKDTTWVQYVVTDACGNVTRCRIEVLIEDKLDPVAICDQHTVISLNEQGVGKLFATSVNNGSFDNCEIDSMAIRRMNDWCGVPGNTNFGKSVTFCCEDLSRNPHMVVFRVWDKKGNFNDCMVSVTVQEKIPPTISCPRDITVNCGTDISDLSIVGSATASNTCANTRVTYKNDTITWRCGVGTIKRRWTATSAGGQIAVCDQYITTFDYNPITGNSIFWPADITVNGCKASDAHPDFSGKPVLPVTPCSNLISGYTDERFYNIGGFCIKIIRHWRVIDWCLYDVNNPNSVGIYTRDQIVYVRNTVAPVIDNASCAPREVCANDATCDANVQIIGTATDDCTDNAKLIWSYRVDYNNDGSFNISNPGNNASGVYPVGTHRIEWTVMDSCGNSSTCLQTLRVKDCKAPTPFCKTGIITVPMPSSGTVSVPARFYNEKSEDNCTPRSLLRYSYTTNVNDTIRTYTCADIRNGVLDSVNVTMYVTDLDGNQNFCNTKLYLQDPPQTNTCPNRFTNGGMIEGLINTSNGSVLQNAHMELLKTDVMFGQINSERTGEYMFVDLPEGQDYKLKSVKNDDVINGVSTADIVLIQKHILGLQKFNSPYQYIAADVNNSKSITAADISDIRKLILGIHNSFKNGTESWKFITKDQAFDNPENPWQNGPLVDQYVINSLVWENHAMNFMGIKMGDINYSARTTELTQGSEKRNAYAVVLEADIPNSSLSNRIEIPIYGSWKNEIAGFQLAFEFNSLKAKLISVIPGVLNISDEHLGLTSLDKGIIKMSWNDQVSLPSTQKPLFKLVFEVYDATTIMDLLKLNHSEMNIEAYSKDLEIMDIELRIRGNEKSAMNYELYQNIPNPFSDNTMIGFFVPAEQKVNIQIFDLRGVEIYQKEINAVKGKNQMYISKAELGSAGIYYYQMQAADYSATKKLVISK